MTDCDTVTWRVLFPPPHNPPGLSSLPNHILVLPILLDSSPVDSSWTPVDSSPLGKSSGLHPTLSPVDSSGLQWTPLDSTGLGWTDSHGLTLFGHGWQN